MIESGLISWTDCFYDTDTEIKWKTILFFFTLAVFLCRSNLRLIFLVDLSLQFSGYHLSHVVRKPVYAICEQQRHRSACALSQSDQRLYCSLPG